MISFSETSFQSREKSSAVLRPAKTLMAIPGRMGAADFSGRADTCSGVRTQTSESGSDGFSMFAAGFSAVQPRETAKLKRMFQIPHIIEPGFRAVGFGIEPVFEMMAVNLALTAYWSEFAASSEYQVLLTSGNVPACLLTRNGDKPVGALIRSNASSGSLVCLPDVDFNREEFFEEKDESSTAEAFSQASTRR